MEDLTFYLLLLTIWLASTLLIRHLTSNRRHRLPPGPLPIPLIGHLPLLGTLPHLSLHRLSAYYGPVISLRLGSSPLIAVNSTSAACEVFKTHDIAFSDRPRSYASLRYSYGGPGFAFGPSTPYWRFMKKLCVSELLGSRTLDALRPIRRQERLRLVATLNEAAARGVFTAGSDTTATLLEWALAELINNPSIQYKAQQELDSVVGKHRLVEESDVPNLPYLQSIAKETLRLHSPVPISHRIATRDAKILDYDVPAGTIIFINLWSIHRDPDNWVDPFEFKPERFEDMALEEKQKNLLHYAPFGGGRRGCPGMTLGLDVVHVTLASLVQCFEWGVDGGKVDMKEGMGLTSPRKNPIVCMPRVRLNPFPTLHE
ncbi:Cytochrome P450 93A3 [Acorus gramineus]|uniref:Cytochrome P450 93A3 n=1 Tax=Acorus gramineus TaxID=55184 RepID=A0AAV9AV74_ACOGR|nr:Cytochrome P450 93A3 [Acorus gramineus]